MDANTTQAPSNSHRFLLSPDGNDATWVHPLDPKNPKHADWTDCTDMDDEAFQRLVCERQSQPRIVSLGIAA
jgi:hypothetical protein